MEGIDFHFKKAIIIILGNSFTKKSANVHLEFSLLLWHAILDEVIQHRGPDDLSDDGDKANVTSRFSNDFLVISSRLACKMSTRYSGMI